MSKCNWTMDEAKQWIKDHQKAFYFSFPHDAFIEDMGHEVRLIIDGNGKEFPPLTPLAYPAEKKKPSQAEIKDEIDYLQTMIEESGINQDNKEKALELADDIISRFPGNDIPVSIREDLLKLLGPTKQEREKFQLAAIKNIIEQKLAIEAKEAEEKKKQIEVVHNIVARMFADEAKQEEKTQKSVIGKIIRRKLLEV